MRRHQYYPTVAVHTTAPSSHDCTFETVKRSCNHCLDKQQYLRSISETTPTHYPRDTIVSHQGWCPLEPVKCCCIIVAAQARVPCHNTTTEAYGQGYGLGIGLGLGPSRLTNKKLRYGHQGFFRNRSHTRVKVPVRYSPPSGRTRRAPSVCGTLFRGPPRR